jgi:ATP-binding cassette subfamily F protein uup
VIAPEGDGKWVEYAGGYSDMLVQRGADLKREPVKVGPARETRPAADPSPVPAVPRRKLSFKDKHALETLPKTIADLQAVIARQQKVLDDPALFTRDRSAFEAASLKLAEAQQALEDAETRWLELEMMREEIEGG